MLSAIVRRIPGVTEKKIPSTYRMIKDLNPDIENLDRIYAGQEIVLPGKPAPVTPAQASSATTGETAPSSQASGAQDYQVKKGDSLIRIVHRQLHITSKTQPALLMIKSMNPSIKDINRIYAGQIIRLPDGEASAKMIARSPAPVKGKPARRVASPAEKPGAQPVGIVEEKIDVLPPGDEQKKSPEIPPEGKDVPALPPAERLAVVKHIISQMNGHMMTTGKYYLPVSKTEQLTIDCAMIPMVELDGSTILLDQGNHAQSNLKKMLGNRWSNHHLVTIDAKDDIVTLLKKIIKQTKAYAITKAQKPLTVGSSPQMDITVDWIIAPKDPRRSSSIQGIRFAYEQDALLPRAVVTYARKHSLFITEISPEKGLVEKPAEIYSLPPVAKLPTESAKELSYALLSLLDIQSDKDVDIQIFNLEKDGFNLSIKADIVISRNQKKYMIFSRNLPPQFVNVLQKEGDELIFVSDQDAPAKTMETLLRAFQVASTSGYFSFSGLEKNQTPFAFGFSGTKIKTDKDIYVVNFDFNEDLRGLIKEKWSAAIVRY